MQTFKPLTSKYEVTEDHSKIWGHTFTESALKLNTVINMLPMTLRYRFRMKSIPDADMGFLHILNISTSNVNAQS